MFGRDPSNSSEIDHLWTELHDLEKRVSDDIEHRIRSLEDDRIQRMAAQEAAEETRGRIEKAKLARHHKVLLAVTSTLGIVSTILNLFLHFKVM
jgi:hypothetical protein